MKKRRVEEESRRNLFKLRRNKEGRKMGVIN